MCGTQTDEKLNEFVVGKRLWQSGVFCRLWLEEWFYFATSYSWNRLRVCLRCVLANLYLQSDLLMVIFKDTFDVNCNVALLHLQWFGSVYESLYVRVCNVRRDLRSCSVGSSACARASCLDNSEELLLWMKFSLRISVALSQWADWSLLSNSFSLICSQMAPR